MPQTLSSGPAGQTSNEVRFYRKKRICVCSFSLLPRRVKEHPCAIRRACRAPYAAAVNDDRLGQETYGVARLIALSDGIFAIAMTLLILDLPVPQLARATDADLVRALLELKPNFASFVLSFALVGLNWMNHHRLLHNLARSDSRLLTLNLAFLLLVCIVPFAAATLSRYGDLASGVIVYATNLCLMALVSGALRVHLTRAGLLDPEPSRVQLHQSLINSAAVLAVFLASMPIALWRPNVAEYFWLTLIPARALAQRYPWRT
jgi:uncharacterized membrane protein